DRRYDIHLYLTSQVFDSFDPATEFAKIGGVFVWRGQALPGLPEPVVKWINAQDWGTFIYCSAHVRPTLQPYSAKMNRPRRPRPTAVIRRHGWHKRRWRAA